MHDLVIKGGNIVDGTGADSFTGDVAITNGIITEVGEVSGPARETIDAAGLMVAPGWVDIHTHYDGQATWDPLLTPSFWQGVTSIVMGNCGVGFAPVAPDNRDWIMGLMEAVEDIPVAALKAGIDWQWESFPGYLDALDAMPRAVDVGSYVGHCALRTYVMGERGAQDVDPTPEEIEQMAEIMRDAMANGAMGFSTSRTLIHLTPEGEPIPGTFAPEAELFGIVGAMAEFDKGVFEVIPAGLETDNYEQQAGEIDLMKRISLETGCAVTYLTAQIGPDPDLWRRTFALAEQANKEGARIYPQVSPRAPGMMFSFESENPFARFPSFIELMELSQEDRLKALRDPEVKARILADKDPNITDWSQIFANPWRLTYILGDVPNYEPDPSQTIRAIAEKEGRSPAEVGYDAMLENDGQAFLYYAAGNYAYGNLDDVREMITHPMTALGGSDGGAHCRLICDASTPTFMLSHWARDRGDKGISVEAAVKKQTSDTARLHGLTDRGEIRPGLKADINVIDYENLKISNLELLHDFPAGAVRLSQKAEGYVATLVSGEVIQRNGVDTGARPGTVIRPHGGKQKAAAQ